MCFRLGRLKPAFKKNGTVTAGNASGIKVPAVRKVLERAGLAIEDIDLFELNEAFAAQSLAVTRELGLDPAKVNVNRGAIALGHPIGASGARLLTTLVYALRARKLRYGVASLCIGGGMGIAMTIENLELRREN